MPDYDYTAIVKGRRQFKYSKSVSYKHSYLWMKMLPIFNLQSFPSIVSPSMKTSLLR